MTYTYDATKRTLDIDAPLVDRDQLLQICREIDADTTEEETTAFIQTAHVLLFTLLDGYGIPEPLLSQIEKYLAAHFANLSYPSKQRRSIGPMSESFFGNAQNGLAYTKYGQSAIALDPTGKLKEFSDGKGQRTVSVRSVGSGLSKDEIAALYV